MDTSIDSSREVEVEVEGKGREGCKGSRLPRNRHGNKTGASTQSFRVIRRLDLSVFLTLLSIQ